ncbi:RnfABCDGE type electron transport complex subunit G [Parabacteroides sp. PF5-6]|uniref:RnfABCDGE type electron transport complex subunit G n=1 Tax=Parabacteroides sp. PF5-6 TaxID=1742403 RepID=UPI002406CD89|nr:RnfABCDGE type electron transport complex subunit G [Parabacteroides sp. PF5-6]MDF9831476.1 electron transport complex protein RnfG [Parabacteroides sp. PF5-6]
MAKLKSTLPNMLLSLTLICLFAAGVLATVNMQTAGPIAAAKAAALENAIKEVTPEFDNSPLADAYRAVTSDGDSLVIYPALKGGEPVGVAVESFTMNGFSGEIRVIVGFDTEGKILNYSVLQHAETPGLGSKMQEWFRTDKNRQSVIGRSLAAGNLTVAKDGGDVDAITASTITSRAFLQTLNRAYSAYKGTDAGTGATAATDAVTEATEAAEATETTETTESTEKGGENE